jgi:hypothetical protein
MTGRHSYTHFARVLDVKDVDLAEMSSDVCGTATSILHCALRLQTSFRLADFFVDRDRRTSNQSLTNDPGSRVDLSILPEQLASLARYWKLKADCNLSEAQLLQWRTKIVLQTVYTLTAQRDQNVSIQVARDSRTLVEQAKRHSSSIKAIAALNQFPPCLMCITFYTQACLYLLNCIPSLTIYRSPRSFNEARCSP